MDLYSVKHGIIPVLGGNRTQVPDNPVTTPTSEFTDLKNCRYLLYTIYSLCEILWQILALTVRNKAAFSPYRAVNTLKAGYKNQTVNAV